MNRRNFFKLVILALVGSLASFKKTFADAVKWVDANAPMVKAQKFNLDGAKSGRMEKEIAGKKFKAASQTCSNCQLFMNKTKGANGKEIGQCALFMNGADQKPWFVKDTSSCASWTPGPTAKSS